jgi:hypothetical protein
MIIMKESNEDNKLPLVLEIESRILGKFDKLKYSVQNKVLILGSIFVLTISIIVTILDLWGVPSIIKTILGAPTGVFAYILLFLILEGRFKKISQYKLFVTQKKRIKHFLFGWAVFLPVFIFARPILPEGLAGIILVAVAIGTVMITSKTEEESYFTKNGLVDPRELNEEE